MYNASGKTDIDERVVRYAPLVKRIAYHMMAKLPANVMVEDIVQAGMMGLLDAVTRFDSTQGAQFETYATQRIRGGILDSLRCADWMPRELRQNMRKIEVAIHALEHRFGRQPTESEIAEELHLALAEYQKILLESRGNQLIYFEDLEKDGDDDFLERHLPAVESGPLDELISGDLRAALVQAISDLPEREKMVMALYYDEELNLKEIGEVLGVGESRISQLHSQAISRLRSKLKGNY